MVHKDEKPKTPRMAERVILSTNIDATIVVRPKKRNTHQYLVPVWYSVFITTGWKRPIIKKADRPIIMP